MKKITKNLSLYSLLVGLLILTFSCTKEAPSGQIESPNEEVLFNNAIIKTVKGNLVVSFYTKEAPSTCRRIQELIQSGFYNGLEFHRVIEKFIVQTGDPTNSGAGGSGQKVRDEKNDLKHVRGTIALAKLEGRSDSGDSQFYIALNKIPELDGKFTIFAQVKTGLQVLDQITVGDKILSIHLYNE
jgi:cyclophilin family peptidyl-prolyl cis-trans isomerase